MNYVALTLFGVAVASLIWGRLYFFKVASGTPRTLALAYDLAATTQIVMTLYLLAQPSVSSPAALALASIAYLVSIGLFWSSIHHAKKLDFAMSNQVGELITTGPFSWVRHPFYSAYLLLWWSSTLALSHPSLWISAALLSAFYVMSAFREEANIRVSAKGADYQTYQQRVGMFLPRRAR